LDTQGLMVLLFGRQPLAETQFVWPT